MGFSASGTVAYGIPIVSHDDNGDPTPLLWEEQDRDWSCEIYKASYLDIVAYGDYMYNVGEQAALLTLNDATTLNAYTGDAVPLQLELVNQDTLEKAVIEAREKFNLDFTEAKWYLLASYG